jgi:polar amino acid transport system permease protein
MSAGFVTELAANVPRLAWGISQTVMLSTGAMVLGTMVGIPLGVVMFRAHLAVRLALAVYVDLVRGTPVLVLVLASYYVIPLLGPNLSASMAGVIALGLFCSAQVAEITRGSLRAIDKGQSEAAMSIGLRFHQILGSILFPQALRIGLPAWVNTIIETVKGSSLLLIIGVAELMLTTQQIISRNYMSIQFLALAGLVYFVVNYSLERLGKYIEKRVAFEG